MAWLRTIVASLAANIALLLYSLYELVVTAVVLAKLTGDCTSTKMLFVLQLLASIATIGLSIACMLRK